MSHATIQEAGNHTTRTWMNKRVNEKVFENKISIARGIKTLSRGPPISSMRTEEMCPEGAYRTSGQWASGEQHYSKMDKRVDEKAWGVVTEQLWVWDVWEPLELMLSWKINWPGVKTSSGTGVFKYEERQDMSRGNLQDVIDEQAPTLLKWELQNWWTCCHCITLVKIFLMPPCSTLILIVNYFELFFEPQRFC